MGTMVRYAPIDDAPPSPSTNCCMPVARVAHIAAGATAPGVMIVGHDGPTLPKSARSVTFEPPRMPNAALSTVVTSTTMVRNTVAPCALQSGEVSAKIC